MIKHYIKSLICRLFGHQWDESRIRKKCSKVLKHKSWYRTSTFNRKGGKKRPIMVYETKRIYVCLRCQQTSNKLRNGEKLHGG